MTYFEIKTKRQVIGYLIVAIIVFVIDRVYSIFSHGVGSLAMSTMVVSVLILGVAGYRLLGLTLHKRFTKKGVNRFIHLYNSGIATLVIGQFLKGVLDIAGTGSPYIKYYFIASGFMILLSFITLSAKTEA